MYIMFQNGRRRPDHCLQAVAEGGAGLLDEVLADHGPLSLSPRRSSGPPPCREGWHRLSFPLRPHGVSGRPHRGRPEVLEVLLAPGLCFLGCVTRSIILLQRKPAIRIVGIDSWLDHILQHILVLHLTHLLALGKPVERRGLAVWHNRPEHHGAGRVLRAVDQGNIRGARGQEVVLLGVPWSVNCSPLLVAEDADR